MLKKVKLNEAIGMTLGHDVTKILPGKFKGPGFSRGHIIKEEDIPELLSMGKEHVYVIELVEGEVHEEEAALRIAGTISGSEIEFDKPKEGRVNMKAKTLGVLQVNKDLLEKINSLGEIVVSTLHNNTVCKPGTMVAATKIIPLYTQETKVIEVEQICRQEGKVIDILPIGEKKVGVVITGNEVYHGRIEDKFGEVMQRKIEALGSVINHKVFVPDDIDLIAQAIDEMDNKGSEVIVVCGGMSIDPDDVTVDSIKQSGAEIIFYGVPVMPGTMGLYAVRKGIPVIGAPACVLHDPATIFDHLLPRILAGINITHKDIIQMGHGGLCLKCGKCRFPVCPFGK